VQNCFMSACLPAVISLPSRETMSEAGLFVRLLPAPLLPFCSESYVLHSDTFRRGSLP